MNAVNFQEALGRFEGDVDIYLELVDTFLESGFADFGAMRAELSQGMAKQVSFRAHKMKGASLTVGAELLARLAGDIESSVRERFPGETHSGATAHGLASGEYASKIDELERAYGATVAELDTIRKSIRKQP
jgi:HPt (histidine-containing phosphotransfer) domain-containing protein